MINNLFLLNFVAQNIINKGEIPPQGLEFLQGYISYLRSGIKDLMWVIIVLLIIITSLLVFLIYKSICNENNNNK
ncbi:MAG: hypothetical protein WC436_03995 [Candidatus Babeliales bacterium]